MDHLLSEGLADNEVDKAVEDSKSGEAEFISFVCSDATVDRAGDSIDASGWLLDNFKQNPVAPWAHNTDEMPVGKWAQVYVKNDQLKGVLQFGSSAFAQEVKQAYKEGILNAVSVGFNPKEWQFNEERGFMAVDFFKQELLEISPVPVPCHPGALAESRSKGFDTLAPIMEAMVKGMPVELLKQELERRTPREEVQRVKREDLNNFLNADVRKELAESFSKEYLGVLSALKTRLFGELD